MTQAHSSTKYRAELTCDDAELVGCRNIYDKDGVVFRKCLITHKRHEGGVPIEREMLNMSYPDSVAVIAYDPVDESLALVEQFRSGPFLNPFPDPDASPWLTEVAAGSVANNIPLIDIARREVQEELGCEIIDLFEACRYFTNPALLTAQTTLFCAQVRKPDNSEIRGDDAYGENLKPIWIPIGTAKSWIKDGTIRDAMTLVSVQWLILNIDDLRKRWETRR